VGNSKARKCKHCGEWVDEITTITCEPERSVVASPGKTVSSYNFGEKAFLAGLLSFCLPPMLLIAIGLGIAALIRQNRDDSPGWAIAGIVLGGVALLGWMAYVATVMIALHSH
jgi:hypothetical protein